MEDEIVWHVDCCFIGLVALHARIYCLESFVFIVSTRLASSRYVRENLYSDRRLVDSVNQRQIDGNTPNRLCAFHNTSVLVAGETQLFHTISSFLINFRLSFSD